MRIFLFLLLAPLLVLGKKNKAPDGTKRLCPDGYLYAGDDTKPEDIPSGIDPRDVWYEEASRSPEYSCYKLVVEEKTMLEGMHICQEDEGHLFTPEDKLELNRVNQIFAEMSQPQNLLENDYFTSGLYMHDVEEWKWLGSLRNFRKDYTIDNDNHEATGGIAGSKVNDCLKVRFSLMGGTPEGQTHATLSAVPCSTTGNFVCEVRVQTVTYYAWFVANWVDLLLGFLLIILFVALCVSVCSFGSSSNRRARQGQGQEQGRRPFGTRRPRTDDPNQMNGVTIGDLPPSYDTSVRVHKPPLEGQAAAPANPGRMDVMRNKGKELFAKVYYYRDNQSPVEPAK